MGLITHVTFRILYFRRQQLLDYWELNYALQIGYNLDRPVLYSLHLTNIDICITHSTVRYYKRGVVKSFSFKLPESLFKKLTSTAKERGGSRSALVREAIETFITGNDYVQIGSCSDLAGDLAGCVKGPADLSHNEKLMRGYDQ